MSLSDRLGESHEAHSSPYSLGQELLNMWQIQIQGFLDHLAHLAEVEPLGERIHRDEPAGVNQVARFEEFIFRRLEHLLISKEFHLPAQSYPSGGGESLS
ncbi:MAG: hypothetical protein DDT27_00625 [Dehalococcoidia bacterium]|nr:hypothetical protein [Chloroflexota bacterium]MBT9162081.1 hypothetical protein [Chloroflexota bacterium]